MRERRIESLQAARGIAAMWVTLFHARAWEGPHHGATLLDRIVAPAPSTIDMFFVVSGFVMVHVTGEREGMVRFLVRRWCRIWPSYAVATSAIVLADALVGGNAPQVGRVGRSLLFVAVDPSRGAPFFGATMLHVGWTLNYEMFFYLTFGICLVFGRFRYRVLLGAFVMLLLGVPVALGEMPTLDVWHDYGLGGSALLSVATAPMMWAFVVGVVLGLADRRGVGFRDRARARAWVRGTFGLCLACLWSGWAATFEPFRACLAWVPLLACAVLAERIGAIAIPPALVRLGEISFSIYLFHPVVIALMAAALPWPAGVLPGALVLPAAAVALGFTIAVASVSHAVLEVRVSTRIRDRLLSGGWGRSWSG